MDEAPVIDGRLDDPVWEQAEPLQSLTQVIPIEGASPSQRTDVRIVRTDSALYFGIRCYDDNPDEIVARVMEQDASLRSDDRIGIILDTFNDQRSAYFFGVNPRSSRFEALVQYDNFERNWETIWQARAKIDDLGWAVEIEIPFESVSFDPSHDIWGMNFYRVIRRTNERLRWADPFVDRWFFNMSEAGRLTGMLGAEQGLGLDVVPALSVRRVDDETENIHEFETKPGGDIFYRPVPAVTAAVTANTDFGDTEADLFQANLTRFALFYPEKRAFFLQDATIFEFGGLRRNGRPFFSRRIGLVDGEEVPLLLGGKVTGRVGRVNFGLLEAWTDSGQGVGQKNLGVERISFNVGRESLVGMIATHGDPDSNENNGLIGFDGLWRNSEFGSGETVVEAQGWFQRSFSEGVDGLQSAWGGELSYPNDRINWKVDYKELSSDFAPALGFVNRNDIRSYGGEFRHRLRPDWMRTVDSKINVRFITDRNNVPRSADVLLTPFTLETGIGDRFLVGFLYDFQQPEEADEIYGVWIPPNAYSTQRLTWDLSSSRARVLAVRFAGQWGSYYSGRLLQLSPSAVFRPSPHLELALIYSGSFADLEQGSYEQHILIGRVDINFTVDLSWNTLVQYDAFTDEIGVDSRLRWIIVPGRELHIVLKQELKSRDGTIRLDRNMPLVKVRWTFRF